MIICVIIAALALLNAIRIACRLYRDKPTTKVYRRQFKSAKKIDSIYISL